MFAVFGALVVFTVSLLVIRIATVGLAMTGLSKDLAQFQALSAFTGAGFTTQESEEIVNHPLRRKITMHLMLLGNVGIVVAIPSVILSFVNISDREDWSNQLAIRLAVLAGGLLFLFFLATSSYVERLMWKVNTWALQHFSSVQVHDYTRLLRVAHNYVVSEIHVHQGDWLAGFTLEQLQLANEGVLVLGVEKANGEYVGAPRGRTRLDVDDCAILYGRQESIIDLGKRHEGLEGNAQHMMAITRQMDIVEQESQIMSHENLGRQK